MRLHHGFFKLRARQATYLVARESVAGALGFLHDSGERSIRIFELIAASDVAIRHLFDRLLERAGTLGVEYVEVDLNAHGPRLQRTLLELGFLPAAYVPALAFHEVERLNAVRMVYLLVPPVLGKVALIDELRPLFELVMAGFRTQAVLPRIAAELEKLLIVQSLSDDQARRLASVLSIGRFAPGEDLFREGDPAEALYLLLEGAVEVRVSSGGVVGRVTAGGTVGERAMLSESDHSATVSTPEGAVVGVLSRKDFQELTARRPDIAVILYRNLAIQLGAKLRGVDGGVDRIVS